MASKLRELLKKEKRVRNTMDTVFNFTKKYEPERDSDQVEVRLSLLESAFFEFNEVREKIEVILEEVAEEEEDTDEEETEHSRRSRLEAASKKRDDESAALAQEVENFYCKLKATLQRFRSEGQKQVCVVPNTIGSASVHSQIKLPEIKLPTFSGKLREWVTFRDAFRSLIHSNEKLSNMDRFTYLRSSLSGEALQEISSIELSDANYGVAWTTLETRYQNKKLIVKTHLDALFSIEPMRKESFESLSHLLSEFDKNLQMLDKIGEQTSGWSTILVHMVCSRLDQVTLRLWETSHNSKDVPTFKNLMMFLRNHCSVLQSVGNIKPQTQPEYRKPKFGVSHPTMSGRCCFCGEPFHLAFFCKKFQKLKVSERYDIVKKQGLCLNCLSTGHLARNCNKGSCRHCGRRHHTLLHPSNDSANSATQKSSVPQMTRQPPMNQQQQTQQAPRPPNQHTAPTHPGETSALIVVNTQSHSTHPQLATDQTPHNQHTVVLHTQTNNSTSQVLLSTAIVRVRDCYGNTMLARALLDSCSQYSFVTSNFCRRLRLKEFPGFLSVQGIGSSGGISKKAVQAIISPRSLRISDFQEEIQFNVLPKLTIPLPSESFDIAQWTVPEDVVLADPSFYEKGDIDMIIGAEYFLDLLQDGRLKLCEEGPTLQNTVFGWIVSGKVPATQSTIPRGAVYLSSTAELQEQLTRFWELETCHFKSTNSVEESLWEEIFLKTTIRDNSGRFLVTLPKREYVIDRLGDSKGCAQKRFLSLERRLTMNPDLKALYHAFIREYQEMGHMEEVKEDQPDRTTYYLPHHAVLKPDSTTTKLRVVFDASCRSSTSVSLNDGLMVGPVVQDDLLTIIIRFRLHRLAIVADIAKMYRMVNVQQPDQRLQRILWRESEDEPLRTFQLTTVTYGTASAPYLATRCLLQLAKEGELTHPIAAKVLGKDFYVDDLLTGVEDPEEGRMLVNQMIELLAAAGFVLRKWNSNFEQILADIPDHLRDERPVFELDSSTSSVKTLGLTWEPRSDCFHFSVPEWSTASIITKRVVLSDASRLFDPLGLVGPIVVQAKLFIQTLWKLDCKWDDPLSDAMQNYWREYRLNLSTLDSLSVPRWVGYSASCGEFQLHGFCDASEKAYGACIYLRCAMPDGSVSVRLLMAKSRVAPLDELKKKKRKQSIPRLELAAALLLSHLFECVSRSIPVTSKSYFWTDAMIVLCWLASIPSRWQIFVANRVSEIQHLTKMGIWNHVAGTENPADILSRGMTPVLLQYQPIWFNGPVWLRQDGSTWPKTAQVTVDQFNSTVLEERSSVSLPMQASPSSEIFLLRSSLHKLIRLVAYIRRFRFNTQTGNRNCRRDGLLTFKEYEDSLKHLVHKSQHECFGQELLDLASGKQVKDSSRIRRLNPKLLDGIMCVGGRLRHANVSETRKHPMILDHRHPLSKIVLAYYHFEQFHAGQQLLIASVREKFWITSIRDLARRVIHDCVPCFRAKPRVLEQLMADLPPDRVNPAPPFLKVGVDYCGPFLITYPNRRGGPVKCFVAVFVCLVTKAVHLELVADQTSEAFLGALKRFVARRGRPAIIMCDNATTFVGAKRELHELLRLFASQQFQSAVTQRALKERIEFRFIPARSPNFGGLWEAAVKSFKIAFKKSIGTRILPYDEMHTVVPQIEAVLNSRPLTPLSNDPGDFEALTPGHFLVQRPLTSIAEPDLEEVPANRLSMWQSAQKYVQQLWKTWTTLYLSDLHNRTKWTRQRDNIAVGTMVLLVDERQPPLKWPLARVTKVFRGPDNNIRVVNVRTQDATFQRAISKVCVLPIRDNTTFSNGET